VGSETPNLPPRIISQPVTPLNFGAVTGQGQAVDLTPFQAVNETFQPSQGQANWQLDSTKTVATQTAVADPSIFLSDFSLGSDQVQGAVRANSTANKGFIGFAFGFQDPQHYRCRGQPAGWDPDGQYVRAVSQVQ
jgi:hypothetical protein